MTDITRAADTTIQEKALRLIEKIAKKSKIKIKLGTKIGVYPQTVILDHNHQDSKIYVDGGGKIEIDHEKVKSLTQIKDALLKL